MSKQFMIIMMGAVIVLSVIVWQWPQLTKFQRVAAARDHYFRSNFEVVIENLSAYGFNDLELADLRILADSYRRVGNTQKNHEVNEYLKQRFKNNAEELVRQGNFAFLEGDIKEAERLYREAIKLDKEFQDAYFSLAKMYEMNANIGGAYQIFEEAAQVESIAVPILLEYGATAQRNKNKSKAKTIYQRALKIDPNNLMIKDRLAKLQ